MVDCNCDYCGANMTKRKADRERGWGRFCDKSCKASFAANGPKVTPKGNPVILNKKGEPPITDKSKSWLVEELKKLGNVKMIKPKRESIKDTPKPEGYGDFS